MEACIVRGTGSQPLGLDSTGSNLISMTVPLSKSLHLCELPASSPVESHFIESLPRVHILAHSLNTEHLGTGGHNPPIIKSLS